MIPPGVSIITSCDQGEPSYEQSGINRGVFMNFIIEGLQGKAVKREDRILTAYDLFNYAAYATVHYLREVMRAEKRQVPHIKGNVPFAAVFGKVARRGIIFDGLRKEEQFKLVEAIAANGRDLQFASLRDADLREMDLSRIDFTNANFQGASLIGTKLDEADLSDANLTGVDVLNASFRDANLTSAVVLRVKNGFSADWTRVDSIGTQTDNSTPLKRR
jgi:hypothetical protein